MAMLKLSMFLIFDGFNLEKKKKNYGGSNVAL